MTATDLSLTSLLPAWVLAGAIILTGLLALCSLLQAEKKLRLGLCALLAAELLVAGLGAVTGTLHLSPRRVQLARHLAVQPAIDAVQAEITALETEIAALEREQSANTRTLQMEKQQLQLVNARRAQLASKLEEDRKELDKKTQKLAELLTAIDRIMASN